MTEVWGLEVTQPVARRVRMWRVDQDETWRSIASLADAEWGTQFGTNQLFGRDLCRVSAEVLGEDPDDEPWN